jgi:hypothetical protein
MTMTGSIEWVEVITSVQRRRRAGRRKRRRGSCRNLCARKVGVAGGPSARDRAEPGVQMAATLPEGALSAVGAGKGGGGPRVPDVRQRRLRVARRFGAAPC